jgi:hypothetical protein
MTVFPASRASLAQFQVHSSNFGQSNGDSRSSSGGTVEFHLPTQTTNVDSSQPESQPQAAPFAAFSGEKRFKDVIQYFWWNARPIIGNGGLYQFVGTMPNPQAQLAIVAHGIKGVTDDVAKGLDQFLLRCHDRRHVGLEVFDNPDPRL